MPRISPESNEDDKPSQPYPLPSTIPILPNNEVDPILPEPINAPPKSDGQQPPDSIDETSKSPKIYV